MKCQTPDCTGEHEAGTISHSVVYRERTYVIHGLPAGVCPDCGEAVLAEETTIYMETLLQRKARGKSTEVTFEA